MRKKKKGCNIFNPKDIYNDFTDTAFMNNSTYLDYFYRMRELWLSLYKFKNLPEELDRRFLMTTLFENTQVAFFYDEIMKKMIILPFSPIGKLDLQNLPKKIRVTSSTGYSRMLERSQYELLHINYSRLNPQYTIQLFAYRLYEIQRSIDVNIQNQKTAKIVCVPEQQRLSFENFFKDVKGNVPVLFVSEMFDIENIKQFDLQPKYISDKLDIHKNMVWNEFLTWCGIENANNDKKERLVADEVGSNFGNVEMSRNTTLESLREDLDRINRHFDLNITVEFNSNIVSPVNVSRETLSESEESENE